MGIFWTVINRMIIGFTHFLSTLCLWWPGCLRKTKTVRMRVQHRCTQVVPFPPPGCCGIITVLQGPVQPFPVVRLALAIQRRDQDAHVSLRYTRLCPVKATRLLQASYHLICLKIQFYTPLHFANEMLCFKPRGLPARQSSNCTWAVSSCAHLERFA